MHTFNSEEELLVEVAKACDLCLKPCRHSVFNHSGNVFLDQNNRLIDLTLKVESRFPNGTRAPEHDLEIEIYRSGGDLSITLLSLAFDEKPILWHGKHSVWMDSATGKKMMSPNGGASLEALARRLRASFFLEDDD